MFTFLIINNGFDFLVIITRNVKVHHPDNSRMTFFLTKLFSSAGVRASAISQYKNLSQLTKILIVTLTLHTRVN